MPEKQSRYEELGIDAGKESVREIFGKYVANDFPGAFVNIVHDPENPRQVFTQHMDGDGSKFLQRILIFKETGDISVIKGAVDDALQMNLGDIAASGFVFGKIVVTDVININKANVPKEEVMEQIGIRFDELMEIYRKYGFNIFFLGGETADLPDQVINIVFDVGVYARAKESEVIVGNVKLGDKIYGFASDGQATWEEEYNSGLMANGLTLARIGTMSGTYTDKYPELRRQNGSYEGRFKVNETPSLRVSLGIPVSHALISPTRQFSILIRLLLEKLKERNIFDKLHGISMNTGGGATKIGHVGKGILYRKIMPVPPPIFQIIHDETDEAWRNMFEGFNCGVGIDIIGEDGPEFEDVLREVSQETKVTLYELGFCEQHKEGGNKVILATDYGIFNDY